MKKALPYLSWLLCDAHTSPSVMKKLLQASCHLYPSLLSWASQNSNDVQVEQCWERFASVKQVLLQQRESDNEG